VPDLVPDPGHFSASEDELTVDVSPIAGVPNNGRRLPRLRPRLKTRPRLAVGLFIATCISTTWAGAALAEIDPEMNRSEFLRACLASGLEFTAAVMGILIAHEMGHFLQAKRYEVPATLPFFIPMPISPFGTMGAVIVQASGYANRRAMFDIAISGPLAGLLVTIPVTLWGLQSSTVVTLPQNPDMPILVYGDPLLLQWMIEWVHGPLAAGQTVLLNPLVFAGWVGIFITALNLLPIGQLDGGHILYTLIGKRAHVVALSLMAAAAVYMVLARDPSFSVLLVLLLLMGPKHPPTTDDTVPLGTGRHLAGWMTLGFLAIGLTPAPIDVIEPQPPAQPSAPTAPTTHRPHPSGTQLTRRYPSQRLFMNDRASVASCSSDSYIRRQIFVAAARSGNERPKASTTIQPS
jgi:Zn-dependent protease